MHVSSNVPAADRYGRCVEVSRRVRWDIDEDVIRGREFDYSHKFLPDGLSLVHELDFLDAGEQRFLSQIQGRTYANIFGLVERFINAKVLELSHHHWFGDQVALEALIRFSEEELKHQELFRRIERMVAGGMPEGYALEADPNDVARIVLGKSTWSVLGLTCHIVVNQGPKPAVRMLQSALGVVVDGELGPRTVAACRAANLPALLSQFFANRAVYYAHLATFKAFGRGWMVRLFETHQRCLTWDAGA